MILQRINGTSVEQFSLTDCFVKKAYLEKLQDKQVKALQELNHAELIYKRHKNIYPLNGIGIKVYELTHKLDEATRNIHNYLERDLQSYIECESGVTIEDCIARYKPFNVMPELIETIVGILVQDGYILAMEYPMGNSYKAFYFANDKRK